VIWFKTGAAPRRLPQSELTVVYDGAAVDPGAAMPAVAGRPLAGFQAACHCIKQRVRIRCCQLYSWWSFDRANHHLWPAAKYVVPRSNPDYSLQYHVQLHLSRLQKILSFKKKEFEIRGNSLKKTKRKTKSSFLLDS